LRPIRPGPIICHQIEQDIRINQRHLNSRRA
jgi:hypothetical protein